MNPNIKTNLYLTCGINNAVADSEEFAKEITTALDRYLKCDWGDLCEDDKKMNELALEDGSRLFASYRTSKGKVYIITEVDRTITTVLFASEY